jgi:hypothetical protein
VQKAKMGEGGSSIGKNAIGDQEGYEKEGDGGLITTGRGQNWVGTAK